MTASERQSLGKGYPVRPDADTQKYREVNYRPRTDGGQIPEYMRRGEVPIRKNTAQKQEATQTAYPNRDTNTATLTISREALRQKSMADGTATHSTEDALAATRTISRDALREAAHNDNGASMEKTAYFDRTALHKTPGAGKQNKNAETAHGKNAAIPAAKPKKQRRVPWVPVLGAAVVVMALAILLPIALHKDTAPSDVDYDMAQGFAPDALTVTEKADTERESDPVGQPTDTDTEAETAPPEVKFNITLTFFDRDPITVSTGRITLGELLNKVGYTVRDTDKFPLDLSEELTEDATIAVDTITYDTITTTEAIPYTSRVTEVQTIPRGTKEIAQYGQNGEKTITYTVTYRNGEEISREKSGESTTKYPVEEISTLGVGGTLTGADGNTYSYSYYKVCSATYYDIEGITYLGYNADESVVATDKNYIPMGTKLYVRSDTFDFGVRTAADTGSMIQGWEVDIWLSDSNPQKAAFAKGGYWTDMRVYFLD